MTATAQVGRSGVGAEPGRALKGMTMARQVSVLFVGIEPASLGLDPAGPGPTAEAIQHGIDQSMTELGEAGYAATWLGLLGEEGADERMREALGSTAFDCVVIGGGIRLLPANTALLETLVEAVRRAGPDTWIAFNTSASDSLAAVQRRFPTSTV